MCVMFGLEMMVTDGTSFIAEIEMKEFHMHVLFHLNIDSLSSGVKPPPLGLFENIIIKGGVGRSVYIIPRI